MHVLIPLISFLSPQFSSVQFIHSFMSNFLRPHKLQHNRPPGPSPTPRVYRNPCPFWVGDATQPSHPLSSLLLMPSIFPSIRIFSNESALRIRRPKYWSFSFSISPSNKDPKLISLRMDWLDLLAVQGALNSLLQHHSSKASILRRSAFFTVRLSHPYMTNWKNHSLDWMDLCWQNNVSAFEYAV